MHNKITLVWMNESEWNDLELLACILILEVKLMCLEGLMHVFLYHGESYLDIFSATWQLKQQNTKRKWKITVEQNHPLKGLYSPQMF